MNLNAYQDFLGLLNKIVALLFPSPAWRAEGAEQVPSLRGGWGMKYSYFTFLYLSPLCLTNVRHLPPAQQGARVATIKKHFYFSALPSPFVVLFSR